MSWKIDVNTRQKEVEKIIRDYWIILDLDNYSINDDKTIDVNGSVKFPRPSSYITQLPLTFNKVSGDFDCSRLSLTSLEGCPIEVGGTFDCSYNQLISLEYAPKKARRFVFDNMVKSIYTGDRSCDYDEVELFFRTNDPKLIGLSKILTENAHFLPIVFKYQPYYSSNGKLNENQMDELIEDIMDGLE
jgi:hypothetical protein